MGTFFDRDKLTVEEQNRWDQAMADYKTIVEGNTLRTVERMSRQDKLELCTRNDENIPITVSDEELNALTVKKMGFIHELNNNAGHPKSALFARLLSGQQALAEPPPTSFSYPWYAAVEQSGPFSVMISLVLQSLDINSVSEIAINQCRWEILNLNYDAQRLVELQAEIEAAVVIGKEENGPELNWSQETYQQLQDVYNSDPEFVVKFGGYGPYRLYLGRHEVEGLRRTLLREIPLDELQSYGSVFDTMRLKPAIEIDSVLSAGVHPQVKYDEHKDQAMRNPLRMRILEAESKRLDRDIAEFEKDPEQFDFVQATYRDWYLEKMDGA